MAQEPELAYPVAPAGVPADLTRPTPRFTRHAWGAALSVLAFFALYTGLLVWFGVATTRGLMIATIDPVWGVLLAISSAVIALVLAKAVFFIQRGRPDGLIEVKPAEHPDLFAFVHRVADETGAPRPYRVYLSPRVNAAVFYDFALWNLVFPSRKNLEIGLGLVNVLTLDEFKAVIAHEFGHFAQRSMTVGSWVYLSQQFVGQVVARRDWLDDLLAFVSRIDIRIAWVAWVVRLLVWSVRAILDTAFRGVLVLERALSREMEFQADLVAVSVSGSDSLVHALHKLGAADDAWSAGEQFLREELAAGRRVADLFALQERCLACASAIRLDPTHGATPPLPGSEAERAGHRVFRADAVEVPRMWASHPPHAEREENAKRRYLPSTLDARSPWVLFRAPEAVRARATEQVYRDLLGPRRGPGTEAFDQTFGPDPGDSVERCTASFDAYRFSPHFRGAWLGRESTLCEAHPKDLIGPLPEGPEALNAALDALYPESLALELARARELGETRARLVALQSGALRAPGGVVRYAGRAVHRRELPGLLLQVDADLRHAREGVRARLAAARAAYVGLGRHFGGGREERLRGLLALQHFAEHGSANVEDAVGHVSNVLAVVTADGQVTKAELQRVAMAGEEVARAVAGVLARRQRVELTDGIAQQLDVPSWSAAFEGGTGLIDPTEDDIEAGWLEAMGGWTRATLRRTDALADAALDRLLSEGDALVAHFRASTSPGEAPKSPVAPVEYPRLCPGDERPRQGRLTGWDAFITADGWLAGTARLTAAGLVLLPALMASTMTPAGTIYAYNGLGIPLVIEVGEQRISLPSRTSQAIHGLPSEPTVVRALARGGELVEERPVEVGTFLRPLVWNIAGAGVLREFTVAGPDADPENTRMLTGDTLLSTAATTPFSMQVRTGRRGRSTGPTTLLLAVEDVPPELFHVLKLEPAAQTTVALAHLRWDAPESSTLSAWAALVAPPALAWEAVRERVEARLDSVALGRVAQDFAPPEARGRLCARWAARSAADAFDADAHYLKLRCEGEAESDGATPAIDLLRTHPESPWLAWSAAFEHAGEGRCAEAGRLFTTLVHDQRMRAQLGLSLGLVTLRVRRACADDVTAVFTDDLEPWSPWWEMFLEAKSAHWSVSDFEPGRSTPTAIQLWPVVGARLASGADIAHLIEASDALHPRGPRIRAALEAADPNALGAAARGLVPDLRGAVLLAGVERFRDAAPAAWEVEARALLFPAERPRLVGP